MKSTTTFTLTAMVALVLGFAVAGTAQAQGTDAPARPSFSPQERAANIKANIENRIEFNKDARNALLERKQEGRASSTDMFKRTAEIRKNIAKKMESRAFEVRKDALVKQLTKSLENIENIAARINSRIEKAEAEGRTMTEAKALLVTAGEKFVKAKADVSAFAALTPATSTSARTAASTTVEADLAKPRQLGDAAIKSVKEARDAYQRVVVAIAQSMGLKIRANATTTVEAGN